MIGPLFIHADADIARPFPGLRALYNRVVRDALYVAGMIVEGAFGFLRRRRSGGRVDPALERLRARRSHHWWTYGWKIDKWRVDNWRIDNWGILLRRRAEDGKRN